MTAVACHGGARRECTAFVKTILNSSTVLAKCMIRGDAATRLLLDLESSKRNMFLTDDAAMMLCIPKTAVNGLLHRLVKKGRIYRVERGKYALVPAEAGTAGVWMELPEVIGWRLVEPSYIGFAAALFYWDMTEQKPGVTHVVTTKRKRPLKYKYYEFQFVTVDSKRFFGQTTVTLEDQPVVISDREKTDRRLHAPSKVLRQHRRGCQGAVRRVGRHRRGQDVRVCREDWGEGSQVEAAVPARHSGH